MNLSEPFVNIWRARRFIIVSTQQRVRRRFLGTMLGPVWLVLQPLLFLAAIGFVRVAIFGRQWLTPEGTPAGGAQFLLGLFTGLTVFWLIAEPLNRAPGLVREYAGAIYV